MSLGLYPPTKVDYVETPDGGSVRWKAWQHGGPKHRNTVVILHGLGEFAERYHDIANWLFGIDLDVLTFDWRGQGHSSRFVRNTNRAHIEDISILRDDLLNIVDLLLEAHSVRRPVFLAHSMGALVLLSALQKRPSLGRAAVFCSPLFGLRIGPIPPFLVRTLLNLACLSGHSMSYWLGQGDYTRERYGRFVNNALTSDFGRFESMFGAYDREPELAVGGVTIGWIRAVLECVKGATTPAALENITTPCLVLSAPNDRMVDPASHVFVARNLANCNIREYPKARHELLMERDEIRDSVLHEIEQFINRIDQ